MMINKIKATSVGEAVEVIPTIYAFRIPLKNNKSGQSYAVVQPSGIVLIDTVHSETKMAVDSLIESTGLKPQALLLTHKDVIDQAFGRLERLSEWLVRAPVYIHPEDLPIPVDETEDPLDSDFLHKLNFDAIHFPGHTAGSVVYYHRNTQSLFIGDSAIGSNYDSTNELPVRPPASMFQDGNDDDTLKQSWDTLNVQVTNLFPFRGKPVFGKEKVKASFKQLLRMKQTPEI